MNSANHTSSIAVVLELYDFMDSITCETSETQSYRQDPSTTPEGSLDHTHKG